MKQLIFLSLFFYTGLFGQVCFDSTVSRISHLFGNAKKLVSDDFNQDGKLDVVVPNSGGSNFQVMLGDGTGNFSSQVSYTMSYATKNALSGDVNHDNMKDLIFLGNYSSSANMIMVELGNGNGTFTEATTFTVPTATFDYLDLRDINNDTHLDVVTMSSGGGFPQNLSFRYFYGNGSGLFSTSNSFNIGTSVSLSVYKNDYNTDGNVDYACVNTFSNSITFLNGTGNGSFTVSSNTVSLYQPFMLVDLDYNNDSKIDLGVIAGFNRDSLFLFSGNGSGQFTLFKSVNIFPISSDYSIMNGPTLFKTADVNGDLYQDLIIVSQQAGFSLILINDGSGNFSPRPIFSQGPNPIDLAIVDINNDVLNDLVFLNASSVSSKVVVSLNDLAGNNFEKTNQYGMGATSYEVEGADFDNDGNNDIAVVSGEGQLTVLYGNGHGGFEMSKTYAVAMNNWAFDIVDFNHDGLMDIFTASRVHINTGNRTFSLSVNGGSNAAWEVTHGDFNNDGNPDMLVPNGSGFNNAMVYFGDGLGTFSSQLTFTVGWGPLSLAAADFNNDNFDDLAAISNSSLNLNICMNNGSGQFLAPVSYSTTGRPMIVRHGDFNKDGNIDLIVANYSSSLSNGDLRIMYGNGTGVFPMQTSISFTGAGAPQGMTVEDFNNDTFLDVGVSHDDNGINGFVSLYYGDAAGGLSAPHYYSNFNKSYELAFIDVNGDGNKDLISADKEIQSLSVLLSKAPVVAFGFSDSTICTGTPITLTPSGATTYTWSSLAPSSNPFTPTITATYTVVGENACGFDTENITINVLQSMPSISITQTPSVSCEGSSILLTASGSDNYQWFNGATNTSSISILGNNNSTVFVSSQNACGITTSSLTVFTNTLCQDVWPGDANSDGVADNTDVLELGLHYTQTGIPRATVDNSWQSFHSDNWLGTISNGKNLNHSDCNGDGAIDDNDTLAIFSNYGLIHTFKQNNAEIINPQLSIVPDQSSVLKGTWGTSSVYLGDASNHITSVNGVAFTVDFNNTLIEPNSIWIEYINSFINTGDNLHFRKLDFADGKIYTATTHTLSNNVSGNGKIAVLHYQIKSNLSSDAVLNLGLTQANQSDANGNITPLTSGSATVMAVANSVGIKDILGNELVTIYPNPTNGILNIKSTTDIQKVELLTVTGQVVFSEQVIGNTHVINMNKLSNGIYILNVYENNRIVGRQRVILNR